MEVYLISVELLLLLLLVDYIPHGVSLGLVLLRVHDRV